MLNLVAPIVPAKSLSSELPNRNSGVSFSIFSCILNVSDSNKISGESVFSKLSSFLINSLYYSGISSDMTATEGIHPNSFTKNLLMAMA